MSKGGGESAARGSIGNGGKMNGRPAARNSLDTRNMAQFATLTPGKADDYDATAQQLLSKVRAFPPCWGEGTPMRWIAEQNACVFTVGGIMFISSAQSVPMEAGVLDAISGKEAARTPCLPRFQWCYWAFPAKQGTPPHFSHAYKCGHSCTGVPSNMLCSAGPAHEEQRTGKTGVGPEGADGVCCAGCAQLPAQFMEYFHKRGIIPKTFSSDLVQQTKAHIARARSNEQ